MDSKASSHMMGMRSVFHNISETGSNCNVFSGTNTTHVKGVGCVKFDLELGGFWEVTGMVFVIWLMVHMLSISALEDDGYRVLFRDGQVLLYSKGATIDGCSAWHQIGGRHTSCWDNL